MDIDAFNSDSDIYRRRGDFLGNYDNYESISNTKACTIVAQCSNSWAIQTAVFRITVGFMLALVEL